MPTCKAWCQTACIRLAYAGRGSFVCCWCTVFSSGHKTMNDSRLHVKSFQQTRSCSSSSNCMSSSVRQQQPPSGAKSVSAGVVLILLQHTAVCAQVRFINAAAPHIGTEAAYAHGAHLVLLDGIGLGVGMPLQVCLTFFFLLCTQQVSCQQLVLYVV